MLMVSQIHRCVISLGLDTRGEGCWKIKEVGNMSESFQEFESLASQCYKVICIRMQAKQTVDEGEIEIGFEWSRGMNMYGLQGKQIC
jgi:hypothetical protein